MFVGDAQGASLAYIIYKYARKRGKLRIKWKKMQKNLQVSEIFCTFALAFWKKGVGLTTHSKLRKVGWVAETTSLLNWRAGYRTGGSNPPPSAPDFLKDNAKTVGSSSGLGYRPLTPGTRVRLPYPLPQRCSTTTVEHRFLVYEENYSISQLALLYHHHDGAKEKQRLRGLYK